MLISLLSVFYPGIPGGHNADFAPNNKHHMLEWQVEQ